MNRSIASSLLLLAITFNAKAQERSWTLSNARIEIGNGRVIERGTIVVLEGRIKSVMEGNPAGTTGTMVDCTGLTIYPGFIDGFSRNGLKTPEAGPAITGPNYRDNVPLEFWRGNRRGVFADTDASALIDPEAFGKDYFANGVTTIHAASGRGQFGGWSAIFDLEKDGLIKKEAMQTIAFGAGGGFGGGGGGGTAQTGSNYPTSLMGRIAVMRQVLWDSVNPGDDAQLKALNPAVSGKAIVAFSASTEREIFRALTLSEQTNINSVLVGGREAWRVADDLKAKGVSVLLNLDAGTEPTVDPNAASETPLEVRQERRATWLEDAKYAQKLAATGVPFGFFADREGDSLLDLIRKHIEWGLDRRTALSALTSSTAKILGVDREIGLIEEGMRANLTVMDGDFAKPGTKVKWVMMRGAKVEVESK